MNRLSSRGVRLARTALISLAPLSAFALGAPAAPGLATDGPGEIPPIPVGSHARGDSPEARLYVCIQDEAKIAVIDMESLEVERTIDLVALGFSPNAKPHHIAVEPGGERWYVSLIGENRVLRFDARGDLDGQYAMETPGMLALEPGSGTLAVSRSMSAVNPPARLGLVAAAAMEGDEIEVLLPRPHPVVVSLDGRWVYTGSLGANQIAALDLDSEEVTITEVAGPPHAFVQFALSPDGHTLVAATELSGKLLAFGLSDPARPALLAEVDVGRQAFDPAYAADGSSVWVPLKGANQVAIVDASAWTLTARIEAPSLLQPHAIVFSPDGRRAFVSNNNAVDHMADPAGAHGAHAPGRAGPAPATGAGNVTVIDVATREVVAVLELGRNVTGMGRAPGD